MKFIYDKLLNVVAKQQINSETIFNNMKKVVDREKRL